MLEEEVLNKFKKCIPNDVAEIIIENYKTSCESLKNPNLLNNPDHEEGRSEALEYVIGEITHHCEVK